MDTKYPCLPLNTLMSGIRNIKIPSVILISSLLIFAGCKSEEVRVYDAPKGSQPISGETGERQQATTQVPPAQSRAETTPASNDRPWLVPDGWEESDENPPMRYATFFAPGPTGPVEVAITQFPGDVGGDLANVNRWREQIGLSTITPVELPESFERTFQNDGFDGKVLHLQGEQTHMLAAIIKEDAANRTWFVRVMTDSETAYAVKEAVFDFSQTFGKANGMAAQSSSYQGSY